MPGWAGPPGRTPDARSSACAGGGMPALDRRAARPRAGASAATAPEGRGPGPAPGPAPAAGIAISPDGGTAYVTSPVHGTVTVIDLTASPPAARGTIAVGHAAAGIAISPDGGTGYVTSPVDGTVTVIDLTASPPAARGTIAVGHAAAGGRPEPGQAPGTRSALSRARVQDLTAREYEIFALLGEGLDNRMISQSLRVSEQTVKFHVTSILRKLGVQSRLQAGLAAAEHAPAARRTVTLISPGRSPRSAPPGSAAAHRAARRASGPAR